MRELSAGELGARELSGGLDSCTHTHTHTTPKRECPRLRNSPTPQQGRGSGLAKESTAHPNQDLVCWVRRPGPFLSSRSRRDCTNGPRRVGRGGERRGDRGGGGGSVRTRSTRAARNPQPAAPRRSRGPLAPHPRLLGGLRAVLRPLRRGALCPPIPAPPPAPPAPRPRPPRCATRGRRPKGVRGRLGGWGTLTSGEGDPPFQTGLRNCELLRRLTTESTPWLESSCVVD